MNANFRVLHKVKLSLTIAFTVLSGCLTASAPENTATSWNAYRELSRTAAQADNSSLKAELKELNIEKPSIPSHGRSRVFQSDRTDAWYLSESGKQFASVLLSFQSPNGGWSKGIDFSAGPRTTGMAFGPEPKYVSTIDNQATSSQLKYLARAYRVSGDERYRSAVKKGLQYIFQSQYPSGGWPQIYPLAGGYHDHATFNDTAMVNVMRILLNITTEYEDFAWLAEDWKTKAQHALDAGVQYVIDSQIQINGKRLAWCQQHDPITFAPRTARAYEMVSLSSSESSEIIDLLMELESPNPDVSNAIEAASQWLEQVAIIGYSYKRQPDGTHALVPSTDKKRVWARFYEIETNRPLFGDRDQSIHYNIEEISAERRRGYAWYRTSPSSTLKRVHKWREQQVASKP